MTPTLSVWWDREPVGTLRFDRDSRLRFAYSPGWLADSNRPAISVSLPKRAAAFNHRECRPFFAGLLPEDAQRDAVASALGISKGNDFAFLDALGGDVAGALALWPDGVVPPDPDPDLAASPLDDDELERLLDELPARPLLAGREGLRLSLAGAQPKLPVVLVDGRVALPAPGQPTTHIVKPPIDRFPNTTENEAFVMTLAATVGLSVAPVEARVVAGRPYLLVARYDRRVDGSGRTHRLHQEDFCQALGIPPEQKYAVERGPTFRSSFELLRTATTRPAVSVLAMLDAAIYNLIAGNADAHGKNFSLLYEGTDLGLAPLYDLLATVAYPDLSPRLAMRLGGRATLDEVDSATWPAFAAETELTAPYVRRRVTELSDAVVAAAGAVAARLSAGALNNAALQSYAALVTTRAERLRRTSTK